MRRFPRLIHQATTGQLLPDYSCGHDPLQRAAADCMHVYGSTLRPKRMPHGSNVCRAFDTHLLHYLSWGADQPSTASTCNSTSLILRRYHICCYDAVSVNLAKDCTTLRNLSHLTNVMIVKIIALDYLKAITDMSLAP